MTQAKMMKKEKDVDDMMNDCIQRFTNEINTFIISIIN